MELHNSYYGLRGVRLEPDLLAAQAWELSHVRVTESRRIAAEKLDIPADRRRLLDIYRRLNEHNKNGAELSDAANEFLDRFYLLEKSAIAIEQSCREIRDLPLCAENEFAGMPRAYAIAVNLIGHSDALLSERGIESYIAGFQRGTPLKMSEIWALPDMLRIALLKHAILAGAQCLHAIESARKARAIVREIERLLPKQPRACAAMLRRLELGQDIALSANVYRLLLQSENAAAGTCMDEELKRADLTGETLLKEEQRVRSRDRDLLVNTFVSLLFLEQVNWVDQFQKLSLAERLLRSTPVYPLMDVASQSYYRQHVAALAKKLDVAETAVVRQAVRLAETRTGKEGQIGHYLFGEGKRLLMKELRPHRKFRQFGQRSKTFLYIAAQLALTLFLTLPAWPDAAALAASVLSAYIFANALVNFILARTVRPSMLPRLSLAHGVGSEHSTMTVVPALITSEETVDDLVRQLEAHYLANRLDHCCFAILGDFADAPSPEKEGEAALITRARRKIAALNERYSEKEPLFYYLHRKRTYDAVNRVWMGKERKRGALADLMRLLTDGDSGAFLCVSAPIPKARYLVTLDSDTVLMKDSLKQLIGTMAHPLNRPNGGERGYAVMQPCMETTAPSAAQTAFSRVFCGECGLDSYASRASNIYQDVFHSGIYAGKGIIDVAAFRAATDAYIPDNAVLSHDLLEGSFANAAFLSDVKLYDTCPANAVSWWKRQHRWIRGDWQLLPFMGTRLKDVSGVRRETPLSVLSRWKMFDNLLRSLLPVFALIAFLLFRNAYAPVLAAAALGADFLADTAAWLLGRHGTEHVSNAGAFRRILRHSGIRLIYQLTLLPYAAFLTLDAVIRTLWRLHTRKKLLQWQTAAQADRVPKGRFGYYARQMWVCWVASAAAAALGLWGNAWLPGALALAAAWFAAPWIAYLTAKPEKKKEAPESERENLLEIARATWHFFEEYCKRETGYLPPDNVQIEPFREPVENTSPTNIGMSLLSALCAYEMGFVARDTLLERLERLTDTLERLEKWHGHLYNWYRIADGKILSPKYVSTVDSGNFAVSALTAAQALRMLWDIPRQRLLQGMAATARLAVHAGGPETRVQAQRALAQILSFDTESKEPQDFMRLLEDIADTNASGSSYLQALTEHARALAAEALDDGWKPRAHALSGRLRKLALETDFTALFDREKCLFRIGYDADNASLNNAWYDLLASEARMTSFIAIALDQVPLKHWFYLGRLLKGVRNERILLSWSGTMFEYLMPLLFSPSARGTLLNETYQSVVKAQEAASGSGMPWGVSESGYYAFDPQRYYQYKAFGVTGLGLKVQRENERVVSPYSTLLAMQVDPAAACKNIRRLEKYGMNSACGFYEALDFTPRHVREKHGCEIVKSYMAHHQGMGLCALANVLCGACLQRWFQAIPEAYAVRLLTEERRPAQSITLRAYRDSLLQKPAQRRARIECVRECVPRAEQEYQAKLLSNGHYSVLLTDEGAGVSRCGEIALNRWEPETSMHRCGIFMTAYEAETDRLFSPCVMPLELQNGRRTRFDAGSALFTAEEDDMMARMEVSVCMQKDAEIRRLRLVNRTDRPRTLEACLYFEVCLAREKDARAHPVFQRLSVDASEEDGVLLFRRRPRPKEKEMWMYVCFQGTERTRYCTDGYVFPGRGKGMERALREALPVNLPLCAPLEPVCCARCTMTLPAKGASEALAVIGYAPTRAAALEAARELREQPDKAAALAQDYARMSLKSAVNGKKEALLFERILSALLLPALKDRHAVQQKPPGVNILWKHGISGERPILLLLSGTLAGLPRLESMLRLQAYAGAKNFIFDLVAVGEYGVAYSDPLRERMISLMQGKPHAYLIHGFELEAGELDAIKRLSALWLDLRSAAAPQLVAQRASKRPWRRKARSEPKTWLPLPAPQLSFGNGLGGFDAAAGEYCIRLKDGENTPLPWSNILANERFGTLVTESGGGYTWYLNSSLNKLTPWANDPVFDRAGETLTLKDLSSGETWSPLRAKEREVRHGYGYTRFRCGACGMMQTADVFVDAREPVKYVHITLENASDRPREIGVQYAAQMVLDAQQSVNAIDLMWDGERIAARNVRTDGNHGGAWMTLAGAPCRAADDTAAILDFDECEDMPPGEWRASEFGWAGIRCAVSLQPGEKRELVLRLGAGEISGAADAAMARRALREVREIWRERLGAIRVRTPDAAFDELLNGRLLYQIWSARLLGRTGYYQAGGATGFRDQLQDVLALIQTDPARTRAQILACAARQFAAGDVLHWWHDPARGVRTQISDDRLFLPYAALAYTESTGDESLWGEEVAYLRDVPIPDGKREIYADMAEGDEKESIYCHCKRALERSLVFGAHGLPLMGSGDWNDGMDHVGAGGGESVWLGWLLLIVLERFGKICASFSDGAAEEKYRDAAVRLRAALEEHGWDGGWYRRAYFADGRLLGSHRNEQCSIDCISQSWAVFARAQHAREAFDALERQLVDSEAGVIRLLTPPFDDPDVPVGYIQSYLPGVRENGGQYTHAAVWAVIAACELGKTERAIQLFDLINPIRHSDQTLLMHRYKGEPYVLAGDVYAFGRHAGRAGWTWYTGAAAWMYKAGLEHLLGFQRHGERLIIRPCVPWERFSVDYRYGEAQYAFDVRRGGRKGIWIDGIPQQTIVLSKAAGRHEVRVIW